MKNLKLVLVMAIAASSFTTVSPKKPVREWIKKNKAKIAATIAATVALVGGAAAIGGVIKHGKKVHDALSKAGIKPGDPEENKAIAIVGLCGPVGVDKTLTLIKNGIKTELISEGEVIVILGGKIGAALAYYFGTTPIKFRLEAGAKLGVAIVKEQVHSAVKEFNEAANKLLSLFKGK